LLRTIGFSSSPGLIRVLGIIPGLTGIVFMVASIWMLVAMVIAVRQALANISREMLRLKIIGIGVLPRFLNRLELFNPLFGLL